jgi:hypothetical protein
MPRVYIPSKYPLLYLKLQVSILEDLSFLTSSRVLITSFTVFTRSGCAAREESIGQVVSSENRADESAAARFGYNAFDCRDPGKQRDCPYK